MQAEKYCWRCKRLTILLIIFVGINIQLFGGVSGKIVGRIIDKADGQVLYGCNVILKGSNLGAASDANGYYSILNVPPGVYTVAFSMIGYQSVNMSGVEISIDLTQQIDIEMSMQSIEGEAVTVTAVKPMIQKDLTSSIAIISAEEMKQLPISELSEAIEMQAGFVDGSLRGGRVGEVAY